MIAAVSRGGFRFGALPVGCSLDAFLLDELFIASTLGGSRHS